MRRYATPYEEIALHGLYSPIPGDLLLDVFVVVLILICNAAFLSGFVVIRLLF